MALVDPTIIGGPGWRLKKLADQLTALRPQYDRLESYYSGENVCPSLANAATKDGYRNLLAMSRANFAELIVEAVRERLKPVGFRTGASGDDNGDKEAWRIWQANQLDADAAIVHRWCLTMRDAYVIVGPTDAEIEAPLITIEDPRNLIVEYDPARRRKVTSALKMVYNPDTNRDVAYLYLMDRGQAWVLRAERASRAELGMSNIHGFEWVAQDRLPFDVIPVVGFHNQKSNRSWGEFEKHISMLDQINFKILNVLTIATMQAFKQRAIKGGPTHDPESGSEIDYADIFAADPGAIWHLPETAEMWESGAVDLGPLDNSTVTSIKNLALASRTPLYLMSADSANQSAEGASLAREGLVFKTEDRQVELGESWEQVESLAFMYQGDKVRAKRGDMEVIWAPAERVSTAERYDAASKAGPAGVPWRTTMEQVLGYSPQQVDRMEAERAADALLAPEPPPAPVGPPVPVGG